MPVTYDYYRIFYFVGKYHSFTRAAKILNNSQPNITRAMNNLEFELGCRLFVRSRRGVTLTPEGERLHVHISAAYEHICAGEAELAAARDLLSGYLPIGASETALHALLLPVLRRFRQAYPGIRIKITNYSTPQAVRAVKNGTVELAVVTTPTDAGGTLLETNLLSFQDILVVGRHYGAEIRQPLSLAELLRQPLICLGRDTQTFAFYDRLFAGHGLTLEPDIEAATTGQIIPLVESGLGFGLIPREFARESLARNTIVEIPLREAIPKRHICLIQDKSRPFSMAAKTFVKLLREKPEVC